MRKFWIFMLILGLIVFGIAVSCAASENFKAWFVGGFLGLTGQAGQSISNWWAGIVTNPLYQQYHMLIWFFGGVILTVIFAKVIWPKRPTVKAPSILGVKSTVAQEETRDVITTESKPTKIKEEEVAAE